MSARVPVGPLADAVGGTRAGVLLDLGCTPATAQRCLNRGIHVDTAVVLAEAAGLDVREVWPYWDDVVAEAERDRARDRARRSGAGELLARTRRPQRTWGTAS